MTAPLTPPPADAGREQTPAQRKMIEVVRTRGVVERWRFYNLCGRGWFRPFKVLVAAGILVRVDGLGEERYRLAALSPVEEPTDAR